MIFRGMVCAQLDTCGSTIIRAEAYHPHNPKDLPITADNSELCAPCDLHATWEFWRSNNHHLLIIHGQLPASIHHGSRGAKEVFTFCSKPNDDSS